MKKVKPVVARNARELAKVLGLAPADGMELEFRSDLNDKIIEVVAKKELTHSDVAQLAQTSRTRVTAILNRNTHDISTDLMLYWPRWGCKRSSNSRARPEIYLPVMPRPFRTAIPASDYC